MPSDALQFVHRPQLKDATMLLALTGWMDGGLVSTGTVRRMMDNRQIIQVAQVDPDPFYIYNFPGSMEVAALFRPAVKIANGLIAEFEMPANTVYCDPSANLVFFIGKEPNLRWQQFADCIFEIARELSIVRIIFMGSFGGAVPHTREPRIYGGMSHPRLKRLLKQHNMRPSDYEGPGSFSTLLLTQSAAKDIEMITFVAEIPGYLQGANPLSIEAVTRRLAHLLDQPVDLDSMRKASNEWEIQVSEAIEKDADLAATVRKLEEQYDNELIVAGGEEPAT